MNEDDVAGTITVDGESGRFDFPERYADADSLVYRDPSKTVDMPSGSGITQFYFDPTKNANPSLAPDCITLKVYGEEAERFRIENPGDVERIDPESVAGGD